MGLLDKLKGSMFEDESKPAPQQSAAPAPLPAGGFAPVKLVNQEMIDTIRKQTFTRNTAFTQLISASDNLIDVIPDPTMRLKAAQKMAGAGRSAKEIADAVQIHLSDVDSAERQFAQAVTAQSVNEVDTLTKRANQTDSQVQAMQEDIRVTTARIQELQESCSKHIAAAADLRAQAETRTVELAKAQQDFKMAADSVRAELNAQKSTILSTLN